MSMNVSKRLRLNGWDALVGVLILALALSLGLYFWNLGRGSEALVLVVTADGEERLRQPLSTVDGTQTELVEAQGYTLRLTLTPQEVWVEEADCPTQDCVHSGPIRRGGQSLVCLPGRIVAALEGGSDDGPDIVIG